jgi:hypothetical protein
VGEAVGALGVSVGDGAEGASGVALAARVALGASVAVAGRGVAVTTTRTVFSTGEATGCGLGAVGLQALARQTMRTRQSPKMILLEIIELRLG